MTTTWTEQSKNTATWSAGTKNTAHWSPSDWALLQEMGDYLLQENGGKILLEESTGSKKGTSWTAQNKN
jgi:hypothetical protein